MEQVKTIIEYIARGIEAIGVIIIAIGVLIAIFKYISGIITNKEKSYTHVRQQLGKAILLGLEILVAADIIATVVTEPTLNKVLTLAIIVLIRTFLSISLQVEIEGKFPWQKDTTEKLR